MTFERLAAAAQPEISWQFFPAHTQLSPDLHYVGRDAVISRGRPMRPEELACYSSHYAVWKRICDEGLDQALVMEDDAVIDWAFAKLMMDLDLAAIGINYIKLFNSSITPYKVLTTKFHGRWLIDCHGFTHGTLAYVLTRSGASHFLKFFRHVRRPVDDELHRSWAHGVPNLAVFPFPVFERTTLSTIGLARHEVPAIPGHLKPWRNVTRLTEKLRRARQRVTGYGRCKPLSA